MSPDASRKDSERQFHNDRFGEELDVRHHLDKWYAALARSAHNHNRLIKQFGQGGNVLEYGCADGTISLNAFDIQKTFASFTGIDISDKAIEVARNVSASRGLSNCHFTVMDAEHMTFPDNAFDLVFGTGILHHLDLDICLSEIARVLRPGGTAVFSEPLGHNPALNYFRRKTPHLRTPDEHPLLMKDLRKARKVFRTVDCQFYGMTTLAAVPFRTMPIGTILMILCEHFDNAFLRIPLVRRYAWSVLMTCTK